MNNINKDVADYCNIDPTYGTMEDFDRLSAEAKNQIKTIAQEAASICPAI